MVECSDCAEHFDREEAWGTIIPVVHAGGPCRLSGHSSGGGLIQRRRKRFSGTSTHFPDPTTDDTASTSIGRLLEYIEPDRWASVQEQLTPIADNLGMENVGKSTPALADGHYAASKGKNPGDVRLRTEAINDALLDYAEEEKFQPTITGRS